MNVSIIDLFWVRANLHIVFDKDIKNDIYLKIKNKSYIIHKISNREIIIPVYNFPEGKMIDCGSFELVSKDIIFKIRKNLNIERDLFFNNNKSKYNISVKKMNDKIYLNVKGYNLFIYKDLLLYIVVNLFYKILTIFNRKKIVLFLNENSDKLHGNLEAFYNHMSKKYQTSTLLMNIYQGSRIINLLKELLMISKSRYIIIDNYTSIFNYLNLNKKQKLIQLWHAGVGFKSVGYARFGEVGSPKPKYCSHRKYDYAVVDNKDLIEIYEEVFGISKDKFIISGMPRLDNYLNQKKCDQFTKSFYNKYNNLKNKKVILYAPTYRGVGHKDAYYDMEKINQDKLYDFCTKNNYIVIFKFHPFTNNNIEIKNKYKDYLIDLTNDYDINDLLYISNILITDYSSCAYEATLLNRSILFYRYDKLEYEKDRPVHSSKIFDKYKECLDFDSLLSSISDLVKSKQDKIDKIKEKSLNSCVLIEKNIFNRK